MNSFWLGVIPLACGFSVFFFRWIWSGFTVYREDTQSLQSQIDGFRGLQLKHRDRVLLECADRLKSGETVLQALQGAKADELETNEDLLYVCDTLSSHGHENCFDDKGILWGIPREHARAVLKHLRIKGIGHTRMEVYEFQKEILLAAEAKSKS